MLEILQAETSAQIEAVRALFLEYANSLSFNLCFQSFEQELAALPGMYAPPEGRLLLAEWRENGKALPSGCVGIHPLEDNSICEMKRLYVRPEFRSKKIGHALLDRAIADAAAIGYSKMRLDTVQGQMDSAIALYRRRGFIEIGSYRPNPVQGVLYMELDLACKSSALGSGPAEH